MQFLHEYITCRVVEGVVNTDGKFENNFMVRCGYVEHLHHKYQSPRKRL